MGWIFTQSAAERDYIMNSEEVQQMAAMQVRALFSTLCHFFSPESLLNIKDRPGPSHVKCPALCAG